MTRDEHTTNRPTPGGSAFQETGMDDYLTRVAEAVRATCFEACNENGGDMGAICTVDLPAIIASVPRPETVAWLFRHPAAGYLTVTDSGNATDDGVFPVYAEPVAAQVAVPEQWQAVARECVSHLDDGRTQPALSRSLRKLSAMLDSSVAPPVSVSHGWKLVPVEPTPGMLMAAGAAVHAATYWHRAYCAMLAAAPEAPQTIQCNACDWIGSSADALYLGGREPIGPLCPECHETTGPADANRREGASDLSAERMGDGMLTPEQIIEISVESSLSGQLRLDGDFNRILSAIRLQKFAEQIAAAAAATEREACAQVCDQIDTYPSICAAAIRARGEKGRAA